MFQCSSRYNTLVHSPRDGRSSGVGAYVGSRSCVKRLSLLPNALDQLWFKVGTSKTMFLLGTAYRYRYICCGVAIDCLSELSFKYNIVFLLGDLNINWLNSDVTVLANFATLLFWIVTGR